MGKRRTLRRQTQAQLNAEHVLRIEAKKAEDRRFREIRDLARMTLLEHSPDGKEKEIEYRAAERVLSKAAVVGGDSFNRYSMGLKQLWLMEDKERYAFIKEICNW